MTPLPSLLSASFWRRATARAVCGSGTGRCGRRGGEARAYIEAVTLCRSQSTKVLKKQSRVHTHGPSIGVAWHPLQVRAVVCYLGNGWCRFTRARHSHDSPSLPLHRPQASMVATCGWDGLIKLWT